MVGEALKFCLKMEEVEETRGFLVTA